MQSPSAQSKSRKENAKGRGDAINQTKASCNSNIDKNRLQAIIENIPSAIMVFEKPDGKVIYANKRAVELYGKDPCGIPLDKQTQELKIYSMDGKICPTEQLYVYKAIYNEETIHNEPEIIERLDGERYILNVNAKPLYDRDGKAYGALAVFDDVTDRLQTQEALIDSEERLNMAQSIAHLGSWEYFVKENKAVWSDELFRIFGLPFQKYGPNARDYLQCVHPDDRAYVEKHLLYGGTMKSASFDYRIICGDGTVRAIHTERIVREYGEDGKPLRIMGVEQDITERKRIELKLEEYARDLERLVEERTRQLKDAERLATIGQTAGMIGHDIRNPLQAIAGDLYLVTEEVESSPDSECKRSVQESLVSIQEQVDYMNKIIADLQDYARPLKLDQAEVDLCATIPQLLATVKVPSGVTLAMECDPKLTKVKVDRTLLKRVLVNLTINSIQAMPNGGKVTVKAIQKDRSIVITVADTGVGIPDEIKPKLFRPLMTTKSKGQGFGLAVVKRLVEAQGGAITFESQVGVGTTFTITLPYS